MAAIDEFWLSKRNEKTREGEMTIAAQVLSSRFLKPLDQTVGEHVAFGMPMERGGQEKRKGTNFGILEENMLRTWRG